MSSEQQQDDIDTPMSQVDTTSQLADATGQSKVSHEPIMPQEEITKGEEPLTLPSPLPQLHDPKDPLNLSLSPHKPPTTILPPTTSRPRSPAPPPPEGQGEWRLKEIPWPDPRIGGHRRTLSILMQDSNGPCSLIALANVLILRGSIHLPPKSSVTYSELVSHIADFLLSRQRSSDPAPDITTLSISSALSILPSMTSHLHVDISFNDIHAFKPTRSDTPSSSSSTSPEDIHGGSGELAVFSLCGVDLVHGWVVDPQSEGSEVISKSGTFEGLQEGVVRGLEAEENQKNEKVELNEEDQQAITNGRILSSFLETSATQITYAGLFALSSKLDPGAVVAFFRNSHLTVLYRRPPLPSETETSTTQNEPVLYQLVTDTSFLHEPEVIWETLVDLDGSAASFVNGEFNISSPGGGEYAGLSAGAIEFHESGGGDDGRTHDADAQLARMLQQEEDLQAAQAHQDHENRLQAQANSRAGRSNTGTGRGVGTNGTTAGEGQLATGPPAGEDVKKKKDKCVIM